MDVVDVAIVGLGAMGSAAAYELARRGRRVIGIDRFAPPHTLGSSHGETRIIREAYFEHPQYVPIVQRAYECWARLERDSGEHLLEQTGGLMIGRPDSTVVSGARASAERHALPYEELSAAEVRRRFPALLVADDAIALLEPRAGMLFPERCIAAHLRLAAAHGATLRTNEIVTGWHVDDGSDGGRTDDRDGDSDGRVIVETTAGRYAADRLILSAGAWLTTLVPDLVLPLEIERAVVHWFDPVAHAEWFTPDRLPIFIYEHARRAGAGIMCYGFPARAEGVKIATHHRGERHQTADRVNRDVAPEEIAAMRSLVAEFMPALNGVWRGSSVCLYTNTPDEDFIIDAHPAHPQVLIVSPCSGHGFKFSSAIGEIVADLVTEGRSAFDLTPFRLSRLRAATTSQVR